MRGQNPDFRYFLETNSVSRDGNCIETTSDHGRFVSRLRCMRTDQAGTRPPLNPENSWTASREYAMRHLG